MIGTYYDGVIDPFAGTGYGNPIMQRADAAVGFYWMGSSPLDTNEAAPFPRIQPDTFSIRWIGQIAIPILTPCRTVNFSTYSDDGILVDLYTPTLDRLIDQWNDHSLTAYSAQCSLCPGTYKLDASYYENGWDAGVRIVWN